MASTAVGLSQRLLKSFRSVRTGIILLILVGIAAAAGTLVLQRPLTDPAELERAYSPHTLRWLDAVGLTDVFHSWWFALLLALVSLNIVLASIEHFPIAWRFFTRPYRRPEPHFLAGLSMQQEIPIRSAQSGLEAAEKAFRQMGLRAHRLGTDGNASLYSEHHRVARLAAYVVHASLLLIFGGAIVDALWGYRGYVALTRGQQSNQIELRNGANKTLPFTIRCDAAGQENYRDGTPRRWWSQLVVMENGREVKRKEIAVNDPLVYRGLRFFQSGYGSTGQLGGIRLTATSKTDAARSKPIVLRPDETLPLDADTSVRLAAFVPDFILRGKQVETRSDQPNNPAIQLSVVSKQSGETKVWLFPRFPNFSHPDRSPYSFQVQELEMGYFTGLQVSHEPGQWAVWAGVLLMALGLALAFYFVHVRVWAVPVSDDRGRLVLWVGASASKQREEFQERFRKLIEAIQKELKPKAGACTAVTCRAAG